MISTLSLKVVLQSFCIIGSLASMSVFSFHAVCTLYIILIINIANGCLSFGNINFIVYGTWKFNNSVETESEVVMVVSTTTRAVPSKHTTQDQLPKQTFLPLFFSLFFSFPLSANNPALTGWKFWHQLTKHDYVKWFSDSVSAAYISSSSIHESGIGVTGWGVQQC